MTDQAARYDQIAEGYLRWWAPVLAPSAVATLDRIAADVEAGARQILDLGTGTGTLGLAAVERWPGVEVTGIDASAEMLAIADDAADQRLAETDRARFSTLVADAAELPLPDQRFDAVVSSFVLQLVPNRAQVLREVIRVLRPGGRIAYVTWLAGDAPFLPDRVFDDVLDELGIREPEPADGGSSDIASAPAAAAGLRRAGFVAVNATAGWLEHRFDPVSYRGFLEEFDDEDLFAGLVERTRVRLVARLDERLRQLAPDDFVLRLPIVRATGIRPPAGSSAGPAARAGGTPA